MNNNENLKNLEDSSLNLKIIKINEDMIECKIHDLKGRLEATSKGDITAYNPLPHIEVNNEIYVKTDDVIGVIKKDIIPFIDLADDDTKTIIQRHEFKLRKIYDNLFKIFKTLKVGCSLVPSEHQINESPLDVVGNVAAANYILDKVCDDFEEAVDGLDIEIWNAFKEE